MSDDLEAFAAEARAWLAARLPAIKEVGAPRGSARGAAVDPEREAALLAEARSWQAALYDAGYADLEPERRRVFREVAADFALPDLRPLLVGLHIVAPALQRHGSRDLKAR